MRPPSVFRSEKAAVLLASVVIFKAEYNPKLCCCSGMRSWVERWCCWVSLRRCCTRRRCACWACASPRCSPLAILCSTTLPVRRAARGKEARIDQADGCVMKQWLGASGSGMTCWHVTQYFSLSSAVQRECLHIECYERWGVVSGRLDQSTVCATSGLGLHGRATKALL